LQDNQSNVDGPETEESVWLEWVVGFVKDAKGVLRYYSNEEQAAIGSGSHTSWDTEEAEKCRKKRQQVAQK
jgi:hypothetical protein